MLMLNGLSICTPTYNRLRYLKLHVRSALKYSGLPKTDLSIVDDGSTDGTCEWLKEISKQSSKVNFLCKHHTGAYSSWNEAVRRARNDYVFISDSHHVFGPNWDVKITRWLEELGPNYVVMPEVVESVAGSYEEVRADFGNIPEEFDEEGFAKYCLSFARKHEAIADPCGWWVLPKELFFSVGGFDTNYDPMTCGTIDLQLTLCKAHPKLRFVRVYDSMIYHFYHDPEERETWKEDWYVKMHHRNVEYFERKWKMSIESGYRSIPVEVR